MKPPKLKFVFLGLGAFMFYFNFFNRVYVPHKNSAPYLNLIRSEEKAKGIPKNLLLRLLEQESHFRPLAHNKSSDARGIAQIVPRWHPEITDPFDPQEAIPYAAGYLRKLYDAFGYWDLALASYNWGRGNVKKVMDLHGVDAFDYMPRETRNYITEISNDVRFSQ